MQYYSIRPTSEKKIIGVEYPQIITMGGLVDQNAQNSLYNVNSNKFPNFIPNLDYFVLSIGAKLTDVLSAAMISFGFIVNNKLKNIFENFKLPPHRFYPAVVSHNQRLFDNYYWFFYICDILDYIDYGKTSFFITDMVDNKIQDCKNIHSVDFLRTLLSTLPDDRNIDSDVVFLNEELMDKFDLIKITFGNYRSYISEKLLDELKGNCITGFNVSTTDRVIVAAPAVRNVPSRGKEGNQ